MTKDVGKWLILVPIFAFYLVHQPAQASNKPPKAINGVLDLREWDFAQDGYIELAGEWEFYWQQLIEPEAFKQQAMPQMTALKKVPGNWSKVTQNEEPLPGEGFATYRLKILLKEASPHLVFRIEPVNTSHRFYVNGQLMQTAGIVGKTADLAVPSYSHQTFNDYSNTHTLELVVHISNFVHRHGGINWPIHLGDPKGITGLQDFRLAGTLFTVGCLFVMGLYHLFVYFTRKQDISPLYFGLLCFNMVIRISAQTGYLWQALPSASYDLRLNTDYFTFYLSWPIIGLFLHSLFREVFSQKVLRVMLVISAPFVFAALILPASLVTHTIPIAQLFTLLFMIYAIYVLVMSVIKKLEGARLFLFGMGIVFFAVLNDILLGAGLIRSLPVGVFGVLLFMVTQAFLLSLKSSNAFAKNEKLTASYERFVPQEFLKQLGKKEIIDVELGDCVKVKEMTILFSDIRSFTTLSETMTPEENFQFLNDYLKKMEPAITKHNGVVDKFIGDAIMALFPNGAEDGVKAAIDMHKALEEFNQERTEVGLIPINIGIGLNTGQMMLGTIGADNRMEGTVISDAVNLAARLEGMTKQYGASILISENTLACISAPKAFDIRVADKVIVKGKTEPVTVWEVINGDANAVLDAKKRSMAAFEQGIQYYYDKQFEHAIESFETCLGHYEKDRIASIYLERCHKYLKSGWDDDWDGVERLETK